MPGSLHEKGDLLITTHSNSYIITTTGIPTTVVLKIELTQVTNRAKELIKGNTTCQRQWDTRRQRRYCRFHAHVGNLPTKLDVQFEMDFSQAEEIGFVRFIIH